MTDDTITPDLPDRIEPVDLQAEMQRSYLDYAMSVIVSRALPDVRDGLKPVHRRVLYAMYDGGYRPDRNFSKSARVVGDVMGDYHPHGDSAIYDTLVRLTQAWALRYPLVQGQGNFGSPGDDGAAAAMRYTECRLDPLAMEMVREHRRGHRRLRAQLRRPHAGAARPAGAVPQPARQRQRRHRGRHGHQHPAAQPARGRVRRALGAGAPRGDAARSCRAALMERIPGPDFPTGGLIVGRPASRTPIAPAAGSVTMRAEVEVDRGCPGRAMLVVTAAARTR